MTRYADPSACPDCGTPLPADPLACPVCALPLRGPLAASLFRTLYPGRRLLAELRASRSDGPLLRPRPLPRPRPSPSLPRHSGGRIAGRAARTGVSGASVASILLGLGALCLLVAAVIFLAVAWSWLGVGGRTGVLVALTVTAAVSASGWPAAGLRLAAEALTLVALGLLALDMAGADNAGWLGTSPRRHHLRRRRHAAGRLPGPAAPAADGCSPPSSWPWALGVVLAGAAGLPPHDQVVLVAGVLAYAAWRPSGGRAGAGLLSRLALAGAAAHWLLQLQLALAEAAAHRAASRPVGAGPGVGLLVASVLLLLPVPSPGRVAARPGPGRRRRDRLPAEPHGRPARPGRGRHASSRSSPWCCCCSGPPSSAAVPASVAARGARARGPERGPGRRRGWSAARRGWPPSASPWAQPFSRHRRGTPADVTTSPTRACWCPACSGCCCRRGRRPHPAPVRALARGRRRPRGGRRRRPSRCTRCRWAW